MPQIRMLENVWQGSTLLAAGSDVTVTTELADQLVGVGKAVDSSGYRGDRVGQTMADDVQLEKALAVLRSAGVQRVSPMDELSDVVVSTTLDGMSTGTPIDVAAPGQYRKARIYWRNISATSTRKLYVAANAENSIRGLMQSQDANRRVAELAFGDHIMLYSPAPITGLTFSSDGSITANTHSLLIVWGN